MLENPFQRKKQEDVIQYVIVWGAPTHVNTTKSVYGTSLVQKGKH